YSRAVPGHEGIKERVYSLNVEVWQESIDILERRKARRDKLQGDLGGVEDAGTPPYELSNKQGGEPTDANPQNIDDWLSPEGLADVRSAWEADDSLEARELLRRMIPPRVLARAIAV
ncbi:MAG TPA: hypothetical protein V6C65_34555, partial [Allocoleopsis sp.]